MPYIMVDDFAAGIDHRKSAMTAPPGSLRMLRNAFITAGGEVEKRQTFASLGTLPPSATKGLAFDGTNLVVFGLVDPAGLTLPPYVSYQQLSPSVGSVTLNRVLDVQRFGPDFYVIARLSDGTVEHYVNGQPIATTGKTVTAHQSKVYVTDGPNLRFSAIKNASDFAGTGSGLIDVTQESAYGDTLVAAEAYYDALAVFSRTNVQVWGMDADPVKNALQQTLDNIGLVAPKAVARYGTGDVLFLADTGIRSLRARDSSNAASVNDVGSPVDALIRERRTTLSPALAEKIAATVDPLTGRFWLVWGSEIFALSTYPNSKISAWSLLDVGMEVDHIVGANARIALRIGEELFLYGLPPDSGANPFDPSVPLTANPLAYDSSPVVFETPFFDAGRPATEKHWQSLDVTAEGTWAVEVNPDPTSAAPKWIPVATVTKPTWGLLRVPLDLRANHLAVRLTSSGPGQARLSNMALHFSDGEAS